MGPAGASTTLKRGRIIVGITLLPEQVEEAPPEVRPWLGQQIMESLGLERSAPTMGVPRHLVGCDVDALRAAMQLA